MKVSVVGARVIVNALLALTGLYTASPANAALTVYGPDGCATTTVHDSGFVKVLRYDR